METQESSNEQSTEPFNPLTVAPENEMPRTSEPGLINGELKAELEHLHNHHFLGLQQAINVLREDFASKLKYDQHKDKIIDNLHQELQLHKTNLYTKLLRPVLLEIIQTIDDMNKLVGNHSAKPISELDPAKLLKQLQSFPDDLRDILYRQGVDVFQSNSLEFDPQRQKILKRIDTGEIELDKQIAERLRPGYEWEGKVLRQEFVTVYAYQASLTALQPSQDFNTEVNIAQDSAQKISLQDSSVVAEQTETDTVPLENCHQILNQTEGQENE